MTAQSIHSNSQGEVKYWSFKPNHIVAMVITAMIWIPLIIFTTGAALFGLVPLVGLCLLVNVIAQARSADQHQTDTAISWAWWAGWFLYVGIIIGLVIVFASGKR